MALTKVFNRMITGSEVVFNIADYGAVGDHDGTSGTDDTTAIQSAVTAAQNAGGGTVIIPQSSGYYRIDGTVTSDSTVNWFFEGGIVNVPSTGSLTINGGVASQIFHTLIFVTPPETATNSAIKIRDAAASNRISPYVKEMSAFWFNGSAINVRINKAYAAGEDNTVVIVPTGSHDLDGVIDLDQFDYGSHLVLRGESHIASTLNLETNAGRVGIDASNQDEAFITDIRVVESGSSRSSVGLLVGGTSLVATNTWFGNTKYGILVNGGSGFHLDGCFIEACDTGVMIASNFADHDIVGMQEPGAITNCRFDRLFVYNCGKANQLGFAGLYVTGIHAEYNISNTSGTFTVGETVTGGTSGETMTVVSASSSEIIANDASGAFTVGETLTGGTSGATATFDSSNNNDVRDLQFSQLEARQCDRYGAHFDHCSGITVQGHFFGNGTDASSISAGAKVDDNVENIIFHGCTFADTVSSGSTSYGLDINGNNSKVVVTGCISTNDQSTDQDVGIRTDKATTVISSCILTGNNTTAIQDDGPSPTTSANIT